MYIARILCPVITLGPGRRLVIWTRGCSKKCPGCISQELSDIGDAGSTEVDKLLEIIEKIYLNEKFDGITISGGDPLEQFPELIELLEGLNRFTDDILIYTGYVWEEFKKTISHEETEKFTALTAVLIDGLYIDELNNDNLSLRGSLNQNIIFFRKHYGQFYKEYMKKGRMLQNIYMGNQMYSVGIMNK